jgi:hypothetical protein
MATTEQVVVIASRCPTRLILAVKFAWVGLDIAIVERRASLDLVASRAGGLHSRGTGATVALFDGQASRRAGLTRLIREYIRASFSKELYCTDEDSVGQMT